MTKSGKNYKLNVMTKSGKNYKLNEILKRTVLTEKTTIQLEKFHSYVFLVNTRSTKLDVKKSIEGVFSIKPVKVNMLKTPDNRKKAVVKVRPEDVIFIGDYIK